MKLLDKTSAALKRDGALQLPRNLLLYLARRAAWKTENLARSLEDHVKQKSVLRKYRGVLSQNVKFREAHKDRRAFVIGNGPSLREQDLTHLKGELTFVTNSFWKHPIVTEWQPSYHFMSDPILFDGSDALKVFYHELTSRMPDSIFFVMHYAQQLVETNRMLPANRTYYLALGSSKEYVLTHGLDLTRVIPEIRTVTELALMAAIYMGCSPIYLLGCDHDWLAHRGVHFNFYGGGAVQTHALANSPLNSGYERDLKNVLYAWHGYSTLKKYSASRGIQIYNATAGGFLDVFERVTYESLFNQNDQIQSELASADPKR